MSYGFEQGRTYNRRQDIHAKFGGSQQAGIIPAPAHNLIFIMSGPRGAEYGYDDHFLPDGTYMYFGEGPKGDQTLDRGNKALAEHVAKGRSVLLFHKHYGKGRERHLTFTGEMICEGYEWRQGRDVRGDTRKVIVFRLRHLEGVVEEAEEIATADGTLAILRELAYAAAGIRPPVQGTKPRNIYERSADVRNYVLARSGGRCEGCGSPAPFVRPNGTHYLEPHHIRRVSDGGPDHPGFVIALCPNCHRRVHFGADGASRNAALLADMSRIETQVRT